MAVVVAWVEDNTKCLVSSEIFYFSFYDAELFLRGTVADGLPYVWDCHWYGIFRLQNLVKFSGKCINLYFREREAWSRSGGGAVTELITATGSAFDSIEGEMGDRKEDVSNEYQSHRDKIGG